MAFPSLGNPVKFIVESKGGGYKSSTIHPNKVEGKLEAYYEGLKKRWEVTAPGATIYLKRRPS